MKISCLYTRFAALVKSLFFFPLKTSLAQISTVQLTSTDNIFTLCAVTYIVANVTAFHIKRDIYSLFIELMQQFLSGIFFSLWHLCKGDFILFFYFFNLYLHVVNWIFIFASSFLCARFRKVHGVLPTWLCGNGPWETQKQHCSSNHGDRQVAESNLAAAFGLLMVGDHSHLSSI